jgi:signal transduction histidine kinase
LERLDAIIVSLFSLALGAILLLGLVGAVLFGRHLARRLDRISATAEAIAAGDLSHRLEVPPGSTDEFDRVGASLNAMLDRITSLLEDLRQVSSDLAHDLRTPLARLRSEIENGLAAPTDAASLRATLERAQAQSDALLSLFSGILSLAEVSAGGRQFDLVELDLGSLADEVAEMHGPAIEDSNRTLHVSIEPDVAIRGEPSLMRQAISNLLDNAVLHTPVGTVIRLYVQASERQATLTVEDDGPGIPEEDMQRVLKRFVRLDRSRLTPGTG